MADFGNRIFRAAKLDAALYEEVEADKSALGQAMGVVVLSSIAAGIGLTAKSGLFRNATADSCQSCRMVYRGVPDLFHRYKIASRATD